MEQQHKQIDLRGLASHAANLDVRAVILGRLALAGPDDAVSRLDLLRLVGWTEMVSGVPAASLVYPCLEQLEDEGLTTHTRTPDGADVYTATPLGRRQFGDDLRSLGQLVSGLMSAAVERMRTSADPGHELERLRGLFTKTLAEVRDHASPA